MVSVVVDPQQRLSVKVDEDTTDFFVSGVSSSRSSTTVVGDQGAKFTVINPTKSTYVVLEVCDGGFF